MSDNLKGARDALLELYLENDTAEVFNIAGNFGPNHEYFCLYIQSFRYKPWWYINGIEFRPFRNVRVHKHYSNESYHKIGYFVDWLLEPAFTHQIYRNGQPCLGETKNTSTFVTFICGSDNRIIGFRETKRCEKFELLFETPLKCAAKQGAKALNALAIAKYGEESWAYMYILIAVLCVFIVACGILFFMKKNRIY